MEILDPGRFKLVWQYSLDDRERYAQFLQKYRHPIGLIWAITFAIFILIIAYWASKQIQSKIPIYVTGGFMAFFAPVFVYGKYLEKPYWERIRENLGDAIINNKGIKFDGASISWNSWMKGDLTRVERIECGELVVLSFQFSSFTVDGVSDTFVEVPVPLGMESQAESLLSLLESELSNVRLCNVKLK